MKPQIAHLMQTHGITELQAYRRVRAEKLLADRAMRERPFARSQMK